MSFPSPFLEPEEQATNNVLWLLNAWYHLFLKSEVLI